MRNSIVELLVKDFGAKAIILHGSRARGTAEKGSDWDLFVFTNKQPQKFPTLKEEELDVVFLSLRTKFSWNTFKWKLMDAKILLDTPQGLAKAILKDAKEVYNKGPGTWTTYNALAKRQKSLRYSKRMQALVKLNNKVLLFNRLGYYFDWVIEWWFAFRGQWPPPKKQALAFIKKKDKNLYKQLMIIVEGTYRQKVKACQKIHDLLFHSKAFKKLL